MRAAESAGESNEAKGNPRPPALAQCLAAEATGTFVLTLVAAGADVLDAATQGGIGHPARYLAPGLVLIALIFSLSGISGAHINPAVTFAFVVRGVFPISRAFAYWGTQFAGAAAAGAALLVLFGPLARHGVSRMTLPLAPAAGAASEALLTAILVLVILGTSEQKAVVGKNAALAVGFTVAALGLFASPVSGASMNPARSLGPAVATLSFENWWLYLAGPIAGALIGCGIVNAIYGAPTSDEQEAAAGQAA
ncbi:MAG: aquaporin [Candidatus Eremiobacteraeota bacterium]|jgi:aquaporin Z|nr:aquaporin [Candidatus Eremiobacteraeota bacterium]